MSIVARRLLVPSDSSQQTRIGVISQYQDKFSGVKGAVTSIRVTDMMLPGKGVLVGFGKETIVLKQCVVDAQVPLNRIPSRSDQCFLTFSANTMAGIMLYASFKGQT